MPYGYTVTIWICGAYLVRRQGSGAPGVGLTEGLGFAAGALLAFGVLAAIAGGLPQRGAGASPEADIRHPIFAAGLHFLAVGLAGGSSMLASRWLGDAAWFFAPFFATGIYVLIASVELAFALELSSRDSRFAHGVRVRRPAHVAANAPDASEERDRV